MADMWDDADPVVNLLTSREVADLVGVTYRQLDHWTRRGYLPIGDRTPGSGVPRRWWPDEVERARVFAALADIGVEPAAIARALPTLLVGRGRYLIDLARDGWPSGGCTIVGEIP